MPNDTKTFIERVAAAAAKLAYLQKEGFNKHFKYSFVGEAQVKAAVKAALAEFGLVLKSVDYQPLGEITGRTAVLRCTVVVGDAASINGNCVTYVGIGAGTDSSDKAPMKACAAALKYALTSGFLIPTGDDPENDAEEPEEEPPTKPSKRPSARASKQPPSVSEPAPAGGKDGTDSTNLALKAATEIAETTSIKELEELAKSKLAGLKAKLSPGDYKTLLSAYSEQKEALGKN